MSLVLHRIVLVFLAASILMVIGCEKFEQETNVSRAMKALDLEFVKSNERGGGKPETLLSTWRAIDVSDTPADFQIAWSEAYRAYQSMVNYPRTQPRTESESVLDSMNRFQRDVANDVDRTKENLEIVAGQYVPEIKERHSQRKALKAEYLNLLRKE